MLTRVISLIVLLLATGCDVLSSEEDDSTETTAPAANTSVTDNVQVLD